MKRLLELARSKTFQDRSSCEDEPSNLMPLVTKSRSYSPGPTHRACLACGDFDFGYDTIPLEIFRHSARSGCCFCTAIVTALYTYAADERCQAADAELSRSYGDCLTMDVLGREDMTIRFDRYHAQDPTCGGLKMALSGEKFHLEVFAASQGGNPFGLKDAPDVSGDTSSSASFNRLLSWLQDCEANHPLCNMTKGGARPERILEISKKKDIRLVTDIERGARYVCLSHCWGHVVPLRTSRGLVENFHARIPWQELPKTFQEAIALTRKLGIKYIWIDSLCIVQDDPEDWEKEAAKMASIYRDAFLTIAATHASDSSKGLFSKAPSSHLLRKFSCPGPDGGTYDLCIRRQIPHVPPANFAVQLQHSTYHRRHPLMGRGWAYQERLLSRRVVHFGSSEMVWECMTQTWCECAGAERDDCGFHTKTDHADLLLLAPPDGPAADDIDARWRRMVREYCQNQFTFEDDIFPALSGLAQQMAERRKTRYLAGMWEDSLLKDLLWKAAWPAKRPSKWRAPTWSWASILGPITYHPADDLGLVRRPSENNMLNSMSTLGLSEPDRLFWYATVLAAGCIATGMDPFGKISFGSIQIQGVLKRCTLQFSGKMKRILDVPSLAKLRDSDIHLDCRPDAVEQEPVYFLKMARRETHSSSYECIFLVLHLRSVASEQYERVGIASAFETSIESCDDILSEGQHCAITIV